MPFHRDSMGEDGEPKFEASETKISVTKEGSQAKVAGLSIEQNPYMEGQNKDSQRAAWWNEGFNGETNE